jgi:DNA primase
MKGLCPFHDEKTPSFQVTPSRGYWYCFGACGEGGDVISFMQKIDNLSFVEAVQRLADRSASNCASMTTAEPVRSRGSGCG